MTEPVPDGSLAPPRIVDPRDPASKPGPSDTRAIRGNRVSVPAGTQHVPEGTEHVPDLPRFGRFQAVAELGAGGMGTVFRAHDDVLGRIVAIKTLHAGDDRGFRERFLREARAIGAVRHPHILAIFDAGTEGETPYLVMELAAGGSLRDRIKAGAMPVDDVRAVGIQIARALAAAHAMNILHRDIKPANILCAQDGAWKLADFGIARLPDSTLTVTGQFLGSPSYAAPESLRAAEFSPASDVYGLGATLYEALTGTPPYGDHDLSSLVRKLEHDPPPLRDRIAVPPALGDVIMAALSRDPSMRPSAEQLAQRLASAEQVAQPLAFAEQLPQRLAPAGISTPLAVPAPARATWSRRRKLAIAGLATAALLIVILAATRRSPETAAQTVPPATPATTTESGTVPAGESTDPNTDPDQIQNATQPMVLDENGNPVDEETARRILEQIERDNREDPRPRGRGYYKHKGRGY
jgi:serine/threonine protein kinase